MPGSILEYDLLSSQYSISEYWSPIEVTSNSKNMNFDVTFEEAVLETESILRRVVKSQMISDVPIGCFLSGGIDSSLIAAIMQDQSYKPINTFSIGSEGSKFDEAKNAKRISDHLGTCHHELYLNENEIIDVVPEALSVYGEPFSDSSQIPTLIVSRLAKRHVSVALTGDAGDELFGGYNRYLFTDRYWPTLSRVPHKLRKFCPDLIA